MTPKHRKNLIRNQISTLIQRERLETTVAKAKYVQYYANEIIDLAKSGTESDLNIVSQFISQPEKHFPKLITEIAPRYQNTSDYTHIILNGTNGGKKNADHHPKAILELIGSKNSVKLAFAKKFKNDIETRLENVENTLYSKKKELLVDPVTGNIKEFSFFTEKDILRTEKLRLLREERKYTRILKEFTKNLESHKQQSIDLLKFKDRYEEINKERSEKSIAAAVVDNGKPIASVKPFNRNAKSISNQAEVEEKKPAESTKVEDKPSRGFKFLKRPKWFRGSIIFDDIFRFFDSPTLTYYTNFFNSFIWNSLMVFGVLFYQLLTIQRFSMIIQKIKPYPKFIDAVLAFIVIGLNLVPLGVGWTRQQCKKDYNFGPKSSLCSTPAFSSSVVQNQFWTIQAVGTPVFESILGLIVLITLLRMKKISDIFNNCQNSSTEVAQKLKKIQKGIKIFLTVWMILVWAAGLLNCINNYINSVSQFSFFLQTCQFTMYFEFHKKITQLAQISMGIVPELKASALESGVNKIKLKISRKLSGFEAEGEDGMENELKSALASDMGLMKSTCSEGDAIDNQCQSNISKTSPNAVDDNY
ncbi:hypothetical protein HK099_001236 [Clydaea vesicula]|uniref:Uncharacterized protein n=1 Tax=Clydaea vesicula TaxID=447962 RepID=A0AAD5U3M0_9FUNG|nr:hypothetical protein HK099_001236 [Clydaea vesicula]